MKLRLLGALVVITPLCAAAPAWADQQFVFNTPGTQAWTVPAGITQVTVDATGAAGGADAGNNGCVPGDGGEVKATVPVTGGEKLAIGVGGAGSAASGNAGGAGGPGGGGAGGTAASGDFGGGGGGGASNVTGPQGLLLAAGGGGGCGGHASPAVGGDGGNDQANGATGAAGGVGGPATGGGGGTANAAGSGGTSAPSTDAGGGAGNGSQAGAGAGDPAYNAGGGGGGGYLAGGGGGGTEQGFGIGAGGGGGSDYAAPGITLQSESHGTGTGSGQVTITYTSPPGTTMLGQLPDSNHDAHSLSNPGQGWLQLSSFDNGYTVPADGVITSWSFAGIGITPSPTVEFWVARGGPAPVLNGGNDSGSYTAVAAATAGAQTAGVNTYPARIPVRSGDVIGLYSTGRLLMFETPNRFSDVALPFDADGQLPGELANGKTVAEQYASYRQQTAVIDQQLGITQQGLAVAVAAQWEPDADHDGFGDVTQDMCPGVYGSVQGCPKADLALSQTGPATATADQNFTYTLTATDNGPDPVSDVTVTDPLAAGAQLVSATPSSGTCESTSGPLSCDVGALNNGASATVTVVLRATQAGTIGNTASVDSPTLHGLPAGLDVGDQIPANNSATASTTVLPTPATGATGSPSPDGFAGVTFASGRSVTVKNGRAVLVIRSKAAAHGTVELTMTSVRTVGTGKHRHRQRVTTVLGKASFTVAAGHMVKVSVRLSGQALALLKKQASLATAQLASAIDNRGTTKSTSAKLTLKAQMKRSQRPRSST